MHIWVRFDEPIRAADGDNVTLSTGGVAVPLVFDTATDGNRQLVLRPANPLQANAVYILTLTGIEDLAGNALAGPASVTFTTRDGADLVSPRVASFNPPAGATGVSRATSIVVTFSERINAVSVLGTAFRVNGPSGQLSGDLTVSADGLVVTFVPATLLAPSASHSIIVSGVQDQAGNSMFASTSFTTGP